MSLLKSKNLGLFAVGIAVFTLAAAQGCSSSDTQVTPASAGSAGSAGKAGGTVSEAGAAGVAEGGSGNSTSNGGSGNTGNTGNEAGAGGEAGVGGEAGAPTCTGPDGCYLCAPTTTTEFENGCVTGGCPDSFTDTLSKASLVGTL
jgi:hypothetical protein